MGKIEGKKLQAFCVNRIRPLVKVPIIQNKLSSPSFVKKSDINDQGNSISDDVVKKGEEVIKVAAGRKIMVVVDSSAAAKAALQWTLTHTVQSHDSIVLLHITKLSKKGKEDGKKMLSSKVLELLHTMKKTCQSTRPEVEVTVKIKEGKEKGPTIVEEAQSEDVSLLVLGQKKRSTALQLLLMWAGSKIVAGGDMVDYCIQNATCMALAVRRKSKKIGGYLITTKRQKDFWLLA